MYEIAVHCEFCAAHALMISGQCEPVHGHNWKVTAVIAGTTLDPDGLLCDFHTAEDVLKEIVSPFDNNNLNACEPFSTGTNPSAELVAKHIADELADRLDEALRPHARVASVSVTEAPGCIAKYVRVGRGEG